MTGADAFFLVVEERAMLPAVENYDQLLAG